MDPQFREVIPDAREIQAWDTAMGLAQGDFREVVLAGLIGWRTVMAAQREGAAVDGMSEAAERQAERLTAALRDLNDMAAARAALELAVLGALAGQTIWYLPVVERAEGSLKGVVAGRDQKAISDLERVATRGVELTRRLRAAWAAKPRLRPSDRATALTLLKDWPIDEELKPPGFETVRTWLRKNRRCLEDRWEAAQELPKPHGQLGPVVPHGAAPGDQHETASKRL